MTIKQAFAIAAAHKCMIGRRRPGVYYVSFSNGMKVTEVEITGKTVKCATDWILANRAAA